MGIIGSQHAGGLMPAGDMVAGDRLLPPARYAVDIRGGGETVVYGEQCLAPNLCFTWHFYVRIGASLLRWISFNQQSSDRKIK